MRERQSGLWTRSNGGGGCVAQTSKRRIRFVLLSFLLVHSACAHPPSRPDGGIRAGDFAFLRERLGWEAKNLVREGVTGLSIAVVDGSETLWEAGFGYADGDGEVAVTPDTVFEVASLSKLFTAVAVMQLVQDGLVELDAPVSRYFPEFELRSPVLGGDAWSLDDVTVRTLFTHRSGIPGSFYDMLFSDRQHRYQEVLERLRGLPATSTPNQFYEYNNNAFRLLGLLIEKISGVPFTDYIEREILTPAGMASSSFDPGRVSEVSAGFLGGEVQEPIYPNIDPASSFRTTARDMTRFMKVLLSGGGEVLHADSLAEMWRDQSSGLPFDLGRRMGLAFHLRTMPGVGQLVGHAGDSRYFHAVMHLVPERGLGVVIMANSEVFLPPLWHEALQLAVEAKTGVRWEAPGFEVQQSPTVSNASAEELAGSYQSLILIRAVAAGSGLRAALVPGVGLHLEPIAPGHYEPSVRVLGWLRFRPEPLHEFYVVFHEVNGERAFALHHREVVEPVFTGYLVASASELEAWSPLDRKYETTDSGLFDGAQFEVRDGVLCLVLHYSTRDTDVCQALVPVDGRTAVAVGRGRFHGNLLQFRDVNQGAFEYLGMRFEAR